MIVAFAAAVLAFAPQEANCSESRPLPQGTPILLGGLFSGRTAAIPAASRIEAQVHRSLTLQLSGNC